MRWPWKKKVEEKSAAVVATITRPVLLNPDAGEQLHQANYRLHAIVRYIEQTTDISEKKMGEFRAEAKRHAFNLVENGMIAQEYADAMLKKVG